MIMECSYAVTAWTQAVEDEHRLLSPGARRPVRVPRAAGRRARRPARRDRPALRDRGPDRPAEVRRQGRLLVGRRRPVQGVARLRRHARLRVGHRVRARPGGADPDDGHAPVRRAARRPSPSCTASAARCSTPTARRCTTRGSRCPSSGCSPRRTAHGRFLLQRVPSGTHKLVARTRDGAEADGGDRRARRGPRPHGRRRRSAPGRRPADRMGNRACPNDCPRPSGARVPAAEILGA